MQEPIVICYRVISTRYSIRQAPHSEAERHLRGPIWTAKIVPSDGMGDVNTLYVKTPSCAGSTSKAELSRLVPQTGMRTANQSCDLIAMKALTVTDMARQRAPPIKRVVVAGVSVYGPFSHHRRTLLAARSANDVPFPRKLTTRTAVSSGKPAARLRSTAIPLRPSVANGKVVSSAWARLPGGRRVPVAAGIGLSGERRDAVSSRKDRVRRGRALARAGEGMVTLVANVLVVSFGTPWGMGTSSWKSSVSSWTRQRVATCGDSTGGRTGADGSRGWRQAGHSSNRRQTTRSRSPVPEDRLEIHTGLFALRHRDTIVSLLRKRT